MAQLLREAAETNHAAVPRAAPRVRNPPFVPFNGFFTKSVNDRLDEPSVLQEFKLTAA